MRCLPAAVRRSLALVAALFATGCEPRYAPGEEPALDVAVPERDVTAGGALPLELEVRNFDLQPADEERPFQLGQGHLHAFFTAGRDLKLATQGGQRLLIPLEEAAGARALVFQLHHNDHAAVDGVPDQEIDVVVTEPELLFVVQRVNGAPFSPGAAGSAELTVAGFALDLASFEAVDVARHGHVHVAFREGARDDSTDAVDGAGAVDLGAFFDGKPAFTIPADAAAGTATLTFALHTNLHAPLAPPVAVEVAIDVVAAP